MDSAESRLAHAPRWQVAAAAATALWCAALTIFSPGTSEALVVQMVRDGAMLGWLGATFWSPRAPMPRPLRLILRMLATICLLAFLLGAARSAERRWGKEGVSTGSARGWRDD